jgi:transcription initiation factor TFIIE subunit alpha
MDKKLIKEVFSEVAGKSAELLVDFLDDKKYMNEFLIAKKLDLPINQGRNVLYKLSEHGLVSSTRKKDKKKGWYTYSWKIEELRCLEFLRNLLLKKIEQIKNQIKNRETREFYVCENCHVEFNEENALIHDFTCPECGRILERKDNTKLLREFHKNLENFESVLKNIEEEISKEQSVEAKKIKVKDAALKRAKAKERAAAREKSKKIKKELKPRKPLTKRATKKVAKKTKK